MDIKLKVDKEFKNLIPAITPEEYSELEKSLIADGCRDPLVIWDDIILDGHNRYEICQKHNIYFKRVSKNFNNRDEAKIWIISNQLARRNLTPDQMKYLQGERYNLEKKGHGGQRVKSSHQNEDLVKTAEKIAKECGVSKATIERAGKFAEAVDKLPREEKQEILSGKSKKTKKDNNKSEIKESTALWNLKRWWEEAKMKDKKIFIIGIRDEITDKKLKLGLWPYYQLDNLGTDYRDEAKYKGGKKTSE